MRAAVMALTVGLLIIAVAPAWCQARVAADAQLVRRLRRIGVESLCRVDLDLARLGLRRTAPRTAGRGAGWRRR